MSVLYYSWWDQLPPHLKTKTQLDQAGFKPGGPIRARIAYGRGRRARDYALYDQREAVAKRPPSPAQLAALAKAHLTQRTCKECGRVQERRSGLDGYGWCWSCLSIWEAIGRKEDQDDSIVWARQLLLDDPASVVILDTETTDLHGRVCEIAVIDLAGHVLMNTLVNPQVPNAATHIHGITDAMVQDAPTFAAIEPELRRILVGKRVAVYNAEYDRGVLRAEVQHLWEQEHPNPTRTPPSGKCGTLAYQESLTAWNAIFEIWKQERDAVLRWIDHETTWIDVMEPYSQAFSEWSDRHGNYRWLRLGGGHRALGDCLACLRAIQAVAATRLATEVRLRKPCARVYYLLEDQ